MASGTGSLPCSQACLGLLGREKSDSRGSKGARHGVGGVGVVMGWQEDVPSDSPEGTYSWAAFLFWGEEDSGERVGFCAKGGGGSCPSQSSARGAKSGEGLWASLCCGLSIVSFLCLQESVPAEMGLW